jgi:hypothetical protein
MLGVSILLICQYLKSGIQIIYQSYIDETYPSPFLPSSLSSTLPISSILLGRLSNQLQQHRKNNLQTKIRGGAPPIDEFVFPSPHERVQFYMGEHWYNYHNNNNSSNLSTSLLRLWETNVCTNIPLWSNGMPERGSPYIFNAKNLQQLIYTGWPKRLPWRYNRGHPPDAYRYHYHLVDNNNDNNYKKEKIYNGNNNNNKQMILQFGDGKDSATSLSTPYPIMVKTRLVPDLYQARFGKEGDTHTILPTTSSSSFLSTSSVGVSPPMIRTHPPTNSDNVINDTTVPIIMNHKHDDQGSNVVLLYPQYPPIIGMYEIHRHYNDHFQQVDDLWDIRPWSSKKETLIWRGASSGKRQGIVEKYYGDYYFPNNPNNTTHTDTTSIDHQKGGGRFVADGRSGSPMIDIAFSYTLDIHKGSRLEHYVRGGMSVQDLLSYKYLLSMEGWCMASGLKWMLYSNSVIFMAQPTKVSWAMECMLVPFVHYIPVKDDYSNLVEMVQWAKTHDAECERISLQARDYMERLVTSEQAQNDTMYILSEMDKIYQQNFGETLQRCA